MRSTAHGKAVLLTLLHLPRKLSSKKEFLVKVLIFAGRTGGCRLCLHAILAIYSTQRGSLNSYFIAMFGQRLNIKSHRNFAFETQEIIITTWALRTHVAWSHFSLCLLYDFCPNKNKGLCSEIVDSILRILYWGVYFNIIMPVVPCSYTLLEW